jgi:hypothetical protein
MQESTNKNLPEDTPGNKSVFPKTETHVPTYLSKSVLLQPCKSTGLFWSGI